MLLEGLFLPLTTPFLPDGRLNLPKLRENVLRYSKTPAAGIVALSHIGQPSFLSNAETRDLLQWVADAAAPEKVLIAGITRASVMHTLNLLAFAAQAGYDAALIPMPSRVTETEAQTFFETIADSSPLPILMDSSLAESIVPLDTVARLAHHRNIIAIIDASHQAERLLKIRSSTADIRHEVTVTAVFAAVTRRMVEKHRPVTTTLLSVESLTGGGAGVSIAPSPVSTLKTRTKSVGFQILCSRASSILDALRAGAVGAMPALSASAPQACFEVLAAWKDGDPALAAEKQDRLQLSAAVVEDGLGVAGIKYASDLNGYFGGRPRLPSLPLSSVEREQVQAAMAGIRN